MIKGRQKEQRFDPPPHKVIECKCGNKVHVPHDYSGGVLCRICASRPGEEWENIAEDHKDQLRGDIALLRGNGEMTAENVYELIREFIVEQGV